MKTESSRCQEGLHVEIFNKMRKTNQNFNKSPHLDQILFDEVILVSAVRDKILDMIGLKVNFVK